MLRKLGLCFQPPWESLHSHIFFNENTSYANDEKLLDLGQATVLRIARLIHAKGGRKLKEIEIQVLQVFLFLPSLSLKTEVPREKPSLIDYLRDSTDVGKDLPSAAIFTH